MDRETREFLEQEFGAIDEKFSGIDQRLAGIDEKFSRIDEQFEETKRCFGVVAEGLRNEIRQVAEGVVNVDEKLERFRQDVDEQFTEVKTLGKVSYGDLDRRVRTLEGGA